jgi:hypothetical protein
MGITSGGWMEDGGCNRETGRAMGIRKETTGKGREAKENANGSRTYIPGLSNVGCAPNG